MNGIDTVLMQLKTDLASVRQATSQVNNSVNSMMNNINNTTKRGMGSVNNTIKNSSSAITGMFKKIGVMAIAAFSVGAIVNFGKECIKLGSDLSEVQNVIDVTFGSSSRIVNKFAKDAVTSFGLSELSAKRYSGVLGSMLKSMGLSTEQATKMSIKMSGLAGDFASFYNLNTDEAFEKIRAGISGETEPLKQLGINMSVANLKAFALASGIKKGYDAMTQQEQALLRYNYLLSVSGDAQGDFARTSNSWANQVRILKLNFDSLKSTLGQAFINILTPVLQVINKLVGWLNVAATGFASFIATITGTTQKATTATASVATGISDISKAASDGITDASKKATKAAKKATSLIGGLDELVTLTKSTGDGEDKTGSVDLGGIGADTVTKDVGGTNKGLEDTKNKIGEILKKFTGVKDVIVSIGKAFKTGLTDRLNTISFTKILDGFTSIGKSISGIFKGTSKSFSNMLINFSGAFGSILGSVTKVAVGIAEALIQGVALYLTQNQGRITDTLNTIFDNLSNFFENTASIAVTISDLIYGFFTDSNTQQAVANCINILSQLVMEPVKLIVKFLADSSKELNIMLKNIMPELEKALEDTAIMTEKATGIVSKSTTDSFITFGKTYDTYVRPALTNFREAFEKVSIAVLNGWDKYIYPVVSMLTIEFNKLYDSALKPLIDQVWELVGNLTLASSEVWKKFISPMIVNFVDNFYVKVSTVIILLGSIIGGLVKIVAGVATGIAKALNGIVTFLSGVFANDWKRAWTGLKDIVGGIFKGITSLISAPLNAIIDNINAMIKGINQIKIDVPDWVPGVGGKKLDFNIPKIPKLADGGIVTSTTQFIAGEAGAEVVFPLQNSRFIQDFAKYISESLGTNQSSGVNFNIGTLIQDDRGYEWLSDMVAKFMARNGYLSNTAF